ncbi:MAG TPA: hypothetical protein VFD92_17975 [Candidatus Binatia bacterium]|nr:hypothetical protein [Candidatus Binatia bacterium]
MSRSFRFLTALVMAAAALAPAQPAGANPVVGVVAGAALAYAVLGATAQHRDDASHGRIEFSLSDIDQHMSWIEQSCDSVEDLRPRGDLYDRLDDLRVALDADPAAQGAVRNLDRLRALPHGEEAYYVALMERAYDYVGYPFRNNRYYAARDRVVAANPCHLPADVAPETPTDAVATSSRPGIG